MAMVQIPPRPWPTGTPEKPEPLVTRVLAPNPSPYTFTGTQTYLVGEGADRAVIDPGPDREAHLKAILGALGPGQQVTHVFVTHSHVDHSPLAGRLARETGAKVRGFGPSGAGRSAVMQEMAAQGLEEAGEGIDPGFAQPSLGGLAAQPATKAIQITVGVGLPPLLPGPHTPFPFLAADQLVTEINGRLLAMLLVADANLVAFVVVDQGDIGGAREGALGEFHRSTHIQQGRVVEKQGQVITGIVAHGKRV